MANYALLEWPENIDISDSSPMDYAPKIRQRFAGKEADWHKMLSDHALPRIGKLVMNRFFEAMGDRDAEVTASRFCVSFAPKVWTGVAGVVRPSTFRRMQRQPYQRYRRGRRDRERHSLPRSSSLRSADSRDTRRRAASCHRRLARDHDPRKPDHLNKGVPAQEPPARRAQTDA